jgi:DNA-binding transcriptional LysR family regulator
VLIRYARGLLSDFGFTRDEMQALRSGLRGTLRVGSVPGAVPGLLAPALVRYKQLPPRVAVAHFEEQVRAAAPSDRPGP